MDLLLNWVWQGSVVAAAITLTLRYLPGLTARARCNTWWASLVVVLLIPLATIIRTVPPGSPSPESLAPDPSAFSLTELPSETAGVVAGLWLVWIAVATIVSACAIVRLKQARQACDAFPEDREMRLRHWMALRRRDEAELGRRRARLCLSDRITSACVMGFGDVIVAVAPSLADHLEDHDLDRVLVHEWAHVQRRDDVARLLDVLIRIAVGWHPAVWWIVRRLHADREAACDDYVVRITGMPKDYARCLTKVASVWHQGLALAPSAIRRSQVGARVTRLLIPQPQRSTSQALAGAIGSTALACSLAVLLSGFQVIVIAEETAAQVLAATPSALIAAVAPVLGSSERIIRSNAAAVSRLRKPVIARLPRRSTAQTDAFDARPGQASPDRSDLASDPAKPSGSEQPPGGGASASTERVEPTPPASAEQSRTQATAHPVDPATETPWSAAADAGVAIGHQSRRAAVATAGMFTRFGHKIARSF